MTERVLIFVPAPQLTVTIEQPADEVELHLHAGGQGVWQARMITSLGVPVTLVACVGGEVGRVLEPLLAQEGVQLRLVNRDRSSGWYVHDRRAGGRAEIAAAAGAPLSRHELDDLYGLTLSEGLDAAVTILSGPADPATLPADTYRRLAADLGAHGGQVIADISGEPVHAVLAGRPCFVKLSHEELVADGFAASDAVPDLLDGVRRVRAAGAGAVLVSRAGEAGLALLDGEVFEVHGPRLEAADPRGAGDSMTAGVASVLARGGAMDTAVRTGAAAGALNVTRHGLGTGSARLVADLVDRVRLIPVDGVGA